LIAIIGLAGLLGGCDGSSKKSTTVSYVEQHKSALEARLKGLVHLRGRLLRINELAGLKPAGNKRPFGYDAATWLNALEIPQRERPREAQRLRRLGFQGGIEQKMRPISRSSSEEGISRVEQFPSHSAARSELAAQVQIAKAQGAHEFPVGGIPGARGFSEPGAINVAFADGPYYQLIALFFAPDEAALSPEEVVAGAQRLFTRLHRA
jgi:hypothetical protein